MLDKNKLKNIIGETLGVKAEDVKDNSKFIEDLGADSLDVTELVLNIEDQFKIKIPDDEVGKFKIVKDLIIYLDGREL